MNKPVPTKDIKDKVDKFIFITDKLSNMPMFPEGSTIPPDKVKQILRNSMFKVFETPEYGTYVIRRAFTPKNNMIDIWTKTDTIIKHFPQLEEDINAALKQINDAKCTGCKKNKLRRGLYRKMYQAIDEDFAKLPKDLKDLLPQMRMYQTLEARVQLNRAEGKFADEDRIPMNRDACMECVGKHLAQAYVLLKEIEQGYPEHVEYVKQHLDEAERQKSNVNINAIQKEVNQIKDHKSIEHLKKAKEIIENTLPTLNKATGLDRWIAIGHLAEASDECVGENPRFANLIREERLRLMEDPDAEIPIQMLLTKAKAILKQNEKEE